MSKRKTRKFPCMFKRFVKNVSIPQSVETLKLEDLIHSFAVGLVVVLVCLCACTSKHYFSINADEITNPSILYTDSAGLTNPF